VTIRSGGYREAEGAAQVAACVIAALLWLPVSASAETTEERLAAEIDAERRIALDAAEKLGRLLEQQPREDAFATRTELLVRRVLSHRYPDAKVTRLTCKTTFCGLVVTFPEAGTLEEFNEELAFTEPFNTGGFGMLGEDGLTLTLFFQRAGEELPRLEPYSQ